MKTRAVKSRPAWRWRSGKVDPAGEHFELRHGNVERGGYEEWTPVALVGRPVKKVFPVAWLVASDSTDGWIMREDAREELKFYLVEKQEPTPWAYMQYHCGTQANLYSKIHWSYFPQGQGGPRGGVQVVRVEADDPFAKTMAAFARREKPRPLSPQSPPSTWRDRIAVPKTPSSDGSARRKGPGAKKGKKDA